MKWKFNAWKYATRKFASGRFAGVGHDRVATAKTSPLITRGFGCHPRFLVLGGWTLGGEYYDVTITSQRLTDCAITSQRLTDCAITITG